MKKFIKPLLGVFLLVTLSGVFAQNEDTKNFVVQNIKVEGLHYISYKTFISYMPIKAGDWFKAEDSAKIISSLYKSGFFDNVGVYQDGANLLIKLKERPVISIIQFNGNKKVTTKQIRDVLRQVGFIEGMVFNDALFNALKNSLLQQYYDLGYYNAQVSTQLIPQKAGGVEINITINEGPLAKIKDIKIIGSRNFSESQLLKNFTLAKTSLLSWFTDDDQYSKEKLDADLENLSSYYFDRGYLQFKVDSNEVSITPNKRNIYITIHVNEGQVYRVSGFKFSGNLLNADAALLKIVDLKPGEIFSRKKVIDINQNIIHYFGDQGYAFAAINPETKLNNDNHTVFINFVVNPSNYVYVRRINFTGNTRTAEYVLRREMRQMEGGLFSISKIEESKRRLENLGYLKDIQPQLKPVADAADQVDLQYDVKEDSSASASLNAGYSDVDHFIIGASLNERNFLGTGKAVGLQFNNSSYDQVYSFNYFNPYFTDDGISFGLNAYAQFVNQSDIKDVSNYSMNVIGGSANYGFPLSDYSRFNVGYGYDNTKIKTYDDSAAEVLSYIGEHGSTFDLAKLYASWNYSNLDRAIFPRKGFVQSVGISASVPVFKRSLDFYKVSYNAKFYQPITNYFVFMTNLFAGFGSGYGKDQGLPFFENYFAGGLGSVRGYQSSTLGPIDSAGNAIGGNLLTYANIGLVFPTPFGDSVRTSVFFDIGNVFDTTSDQYNFNFDQLRYSTGVQLEWHNFLPITLSLATPLNKKDGDRSEFFQFSLSLSI